MKTIDPGFYWGRVQPWYEASRSGLAGPDGWEPVAVRVRVHGSENLRDALVELGERLVHGGAVIAAWGG